MFRINFGNGYVHGLFRSLSECRREFKVCVNDPFGFIQRYVGDGEWVRVNE